MLLSRLPPNIIFVLPSHDLSYPITFTSSPDAVVLIVVYCHSVPFKHVFISGDKNIFGSILHIDSAVILNIQKESI
jgi:hypothetical protein